MARTDKSVKRWHSHIFPSETKKALDFLSQVEWLAHSLWYLAGGTALALQVGHRQSRDLDFFIPEKGFPVSDIVERFSQDIWTTDIAREGTVYGRLFDTKVSFIAYPFFKAKYPYEDYGMIKVLTPGDIAVMKIISISQRGKKRDFVDLYWYIVNRQPMMEVLLSLPEQYPRLNHNYHHILKSLVYFADAEDDPMPRLFFNVEWKTIKAYFMSEVPKAAKTLLHLE